MNIDTILLVVAFICFIAAALNVNARGVNLIGVGLACWVAAALV
jgi:hypothetical protein